MAGQIDLRDQRHGPLPSVGRKFREVIEGVIATMRVVLVHLRYLVVEADPGSRAVRANLVETGMQAALDSPALVVGEVKMQPIQLQGGERVDERQ